MAQGSQNSTIGDPANPGNLSESIRAAQSVDEQFIGQSDGGGKHRRRRQLLLTLGGMRASSGNINDQRFFRWPEVTLAGITVAEQQGSGVRYTYPAQMPRRARRR